MIDLNQRNKSVALQRAAILLAKMLEDTILQILQNMQIYMWKYAQFTDYGHIKAIMDFMRKKLSLIIFTISSFKFYLFRHKLSMKFITCIWFWKPKSHQLKGKWICDICKDYTTPVTHLAYCGIVGLREKGPLSNVTQSCHNLSQAFCPLEHLSLDLPL